MLGRWFAAQCPVDPAAKAWIEQRLCWLGEQFGWDDFLRRPVILPTSDFFPDPVDASDESLRNLFDRVCTYMHVDPQFIALNFVKQDMNLFLVNRSGQALPTGFGGLYQQHRGLVAIHIDASELLNLEGMIGTMAHELAHLRLMGEQRIRGKEFDNELLTDLTVVFHGFGIFVGNSPRNWDSQYKRWPGTKLLRPEYMTLPMFGYALAHAAWLRSERKPTWSRFLSAALRANFKQGVRYLFETGDSTVTKDRINIASTTEEASSEQTLDGSAET